MKRLSDYKDDEAIDAVGELLEPMGVILSDEDILKDMKSEKSTIICASKILKRYRNEAKQAVLAVDDTEITGTNIYPRLVSILIDICTPEYIDFFRPAVTKED